MYLRIELRLSQNNHVGDKIGGLWTLRIVNLLNSINNANVNFIRCSQITITRKYLYTANYTKPVY